MVFVQDKMKQYKYAVYQVYTVYKKLIINFINRHQP